MRLHPVRDHLDIRDIVDALSALSLVLANCVAEGREAVARMSDSENQDGQYNHYALEDNELGLVAHELAPPSASQLRDTVDASGEDANEGDDNGTHEAAEGCLVEECDCLFGELVTAAVGADCVLDEEVAKEGEDDNLEDDTGNHEVRTDVLQAGSIVGRGCNTTTRSLEDEREDVTSDEDVCVPGWAEAGPRLAEGEGDVLESEVDTGGDEGRRDDETADLDLEAKFIEGVLPQQDASDVADGFAQAAKRERDLFVVVRLTPLSGGDSRRDSPYRSMSCT